MLTTASGGSARCILAQDTDTTTGAVIGLVYTQGKFLNTAMVFSSQGAQLDCAQLWQFGVYVLTVLQRSGLLVPMMNLPTTGGAMPANLSADQLAKASEREVDAIRSAIEAYRPAGVAYQPPPPRAVEAPWAIAAFGEPTLTPEQEAKQDAAEKAGELADQQQKALQELQAKQAKELGDLFKQQQAERTKQSEEAQEAIQAAREKQSPPRPVPPSTPTSPPQTPPAPPAPKPGPKH
jgi:hypothetical protein